MKILETRFRVYCASEQIAPTILFHQQLQGVKCAHRVTITETGVVAAKVALY